MSVNIKHVFMYCIIAGNGTVLNLEALSSVFVMCSFYYRLDVRNLKISTLNS